MKRFILSFLVVCALFLTTACGNDDVKDNDDKGGNTDNNNKVSTLTCTKVDEDGESNAVITYDSKKVLSVTETTTSEVDAQYIDFTISLTSAFVEAFNKIDGVSMSITKEGDNIMKTTTSVDYTKFDVEAMKNALGDLYDEDNTNAILSGEDITIEKYENDIMKANGYLCK